MSHTKHLTAPAETPAAPFWQAPSRKWAAARVVAVATVAVMAAQTGWDVEETVAAIGLLSEAAVSYLLPNADGE